MAILGFSRCQPSTELVSANLSFSSITLSDCIVVTCMRVQMSRHSRCVYWNTVGMIICEKALCSICIRYYLRHLPFVSLSVCVFVSGMIQQVVKVIDIRPHRRRAWTVQSYLPGGANVHSNLIVLAWAHSSPHPTRHLDRFSRFAQLSAVGRVISGPPLFPFKIGKWGFGPI